MKINNYNEETEKTMELLEALPKVKSSPYFSTRVEARIEQKDVKTIYSFDLKAAFKYALFIMIIAINIVVSNSYIKSNNTSEETRESLIQELSGTYFLNSSTTINTTNQ